MNTRMIVPVAVSMIMLSAPALAAHPDHAPKPMSPRPQMAYTTSSAARCTNLEHQFDAAIKTTHRKAAIVDEAKSMRAEGANLCASGKHWEGISKLESALRDLGVEYNG